MSNRQPQKIYYTAEEWKIIKEFAKRIGYKRVSEAVRVASLILAQDASYDFLFDKGSLLKMDASKIKLRQYLGNALDDVTETLIAHGVKFPSDEVDFEIYEEKDLDGQ